MVLSTQNPVDLDYKAISNAGTWMIGRLQTERDVGRLEEGLRASSGAVDTDELTGIISGLGQREFVLHSAKGAPPKVFTTRWALDYLAGPLTRDQVGRLPGQPDTEAVAARSSSARATTVPAAERDLEVGDDEVAIAPEVVAGVAVRWVDPAAPWLAEVGGDPASSSYRAGIAARVGLLFDDTRADLRHREQYELITVGLGDTFDAEQMVAVDYDDRDLRESGPDRAAYQLTEAPIATKGFFAGAEAAIRDRLDREQIRIAELQARASDSKQHELLSGAGAVLGSLLGGRRSAKSLLSKVQGVSSRRKASSSAAGRVDAALAKVEQKELELGDLEAELAETIADIAAEWEATATDVTEMELGLEKADISVEQLTLVWVPA